MALVLLKPIVPLRPDGVTKATGFGPSTIKAARASIAAFRAFLAREPMRLDIFVPFVLTLAMLAIEPHLPADDKAHVGHH